MKPKRRARIAAYVLLRPRGMGSFHVPLYSAAIGGTPPIRAAREVREYTHHGQDARATVGLTRR